MGDSSDNFGDEAGAEPVVDEPQPSAEELEAAGQSAMFGGAPEAEPTPEAEPPSRPAEKPAATPAETIAAAPAETAQPYRVLARKYRPQTFSQLIGQEPMVRTLGNAIERDRLAHAFLMTGVRGVGKTSTARLIAKALNCIGPDGQGGPTIDPCGECEPCVAIAEGRHMDVIEMDAASHTGVDDVREIIEAVRYAAVSARYKIYIIDEVHMLSRNAFNALLKTLEEPPAHVKFLFATTEVDKLPVTVLSRTQRFDLRRIPADMLQRHFAFVCEQEKVEAEDEALHMIAAASEGSVRDGLSILDQAIAHADLDQDSQITAERVRNMLGLSDKTAQRRLLGTILEGDAKALLTGISDQYALGVEPLALMRGLMDLVHRITVSQVGGGEAEAPSAEERQALTAWATALSAGQLHRLWQLLIKGHDEVRGAPDPLVSAQMALLRVLHAADMPDPGKLVKRIEELAASGATMTAPKGDSADEAPVASIDWAALINKVDQAGNLQVAQIMRDWVQIVDLAPGKLTFSLVDGFGGDPSPELRDALLKLENERWEVSLVPSGGKPSMRELADLEKLAKQDEIRKHPMVEAAFAAFPDAEIIDEDNVADGAAQTFSRRA